MALPTKVQGFLTDNVVTANSTYADLAKRGETLVERIRKQESTKATTDRGEDHHGQGEDHQDAGHEGDEVDLDRDEDAPRSRQKSDRQEGVDDCQEGVDHGQEDHCCSEEQRQGDHDRCAGDGVQRC